MICYTKSLDNIFLFSKKKIIGVAFSHIGPKAARGGRRCKIQTARDP